MPRRGRRAKTDRLDAEGMTRTLRTWLSGDRGVAREVQIPSVEQEDAKRIERERKYLVEERASIVGRIKGLLALHGIWLIGKRISKGVRECLEAMKTGDGRPLAPFLRRDIERMLTRYELVSRQIAEVEADRKEALNDNTGHFPNAEKVQRLSKLGAVGETTATVLSPAKPGALGLEPLEAAEGSLTRPLELAAQGGVSAPEVHLLQPLTSFS